MEGKTSDKIAAKKKLMPQILSMLEVQGGKSLEQARKRLLAFEVENAEARESLELYAKNWNDVIHPSILSLSFDAVSKKKFVITDLQVMVLFLTAAMDIHDDVMDKSKTKNGKATLYGKFGEDLAILLGDALLMEGFLMLHAGRASIDVDLFHRIIGTLKKSLLEVGNAHLLELQLKRRGNVAPEEILDLIEKKASIFGGISEIGSLAGQGSQSQINTLRAAARTFGYLVMLREEFIDMFEPIELSSRLKNEYPPLPIVLALSDPKVKKYLTTFSRKRISNDSVQDLINSVYQNQNVIKLKESMENRASHAIALLNVESLEKKPALSLASLIKASLEDL